MAAVEIIDMKGVRHIVKFREPLRCRLPKLYSACLLMTQSGHPTRPGHDCKLRLRRAQRRLVRVPAGAFFFNLV